MIAAYTLSVLLMILLPIALAIGLRRFTPVPWMLFCLGSLTFLLSQAVHLPLNALLGRAGLLPGAAASELVAGNLPLWRTALVLGLTAGICEELARAGGYALLQKVKPAWLRVQDSIMLGLGHGGIESMVVGGVLTAATISALLPMRNVDPSSLGLSPQQLEALQLQLRFLMGNPFNAALPFLERALAISAHVVFSLIVWKAFAASRFRHDWYYLVLAILYHALVDFVAVVSREQIANSLAIPFAALVAVLVPGWMWAIVQVRRSRLGQADQAKQAAGEPVATTSPEFSLFLQALRKELLQAWRTRRVLIVGAIFLLFGMGAPLLAKLTPEIIASIPEAQMFRDLIPTPTAGDAMAQYIESLSQFGFILVVLLGMAAVVGEKERGITPMILSKPMPRWAFLTSKLAAQALIYLAAFLLAALGAYTYTVILFGSLDPGGFALLNVLLYLWLQTFVGLTLLGSTLAPSTAAAGGIGLGLSVLLMIAGSLPRYGALLPGSLLSWASAVGKTAAGIAPAASTASPLPAVMANGGAAASALVVVVMAALVSLAVFEQQEL